jgi:probable HAF family extracellular repeat protein
LSYQGYTYGYFNGSENAGAGWVAFANGVSSATIATGINDADVIVGYSNNGTNHYSAFTYSNFTHSSGSGTFTTLDYPGSYSTLAYDINDFGVIVGQYCINGDTWRGFEYDGTTWTMLEAPGYHDTTPRGTQ